MQEAVITFVGIVTVFLVFAILYFIFWLFGYFSKKAALKLPNKVPIREEIVEDEEEKAAIIAAIYTLISEDVKINSIKRINNRKKQSRGWVYWKKTGWRGVKGW
jgi:Na+-transporting methylmalonyl-CoA/oxaloacetate decarboxylase gamma subunit